MATFSYYLRPKTKNSTIQMQLSVSRILKMRNSIGLIIDYSEWSSRTSLPTQNNPENKNLTPQLNDLESYVMNEYNSDQTKGVLFDSQWLKNKINAFFEKTPIMTNNNIVVNYTHNYNELRKPAPSKKTTDDQFLTLEDKFSRFQKSQKKMCIFPEIDKKVMLEFKKWLMTKNNTDAMRKFRR